MTFFLLSLVKWSEPISLPLFYSPTPKNVHSIQRLSEAADLEKDRIGFERLRKKSFKVRERDKRYCIADDESREVETDYAFIDIKRGIRLCFKSHKTCQCQCGDEGKGRKTFAPTPFFL